jgi:D-glycero-D-manno-heptose 1,7-bisphosphate phosphatase
MPHTMLPRESAAVFLDRDGTLIRDIGYLTRVDQIEILPRVPQALRLLRENGLKIVVVTNQSAVARGMLSERDLAHVHQVLIERLEEEGGRIDALYYCPHHPTEGLDGYRIVCDCRKPKPGMIRRAVEELQLDVSSSFVVGDQNIDMELAVQAGARGVRLNRGLRLEPTSPAVSYVAGNLWQAAEWVVERLHPETSNIV